MIRVATTALAVLVLLSCTTDTRADLPVARFDVQDPLQREWKDELVFFPVGDDVFERSDLTLIDPLGSPQPFQWVSAELSPTGQPSVAFLAATGPFARASYQLVRGQPITRSDLSIRDRGGTITVGNRRIAISLGGPQAGEQGPIAELQWPGGKPICAGRLNTPHPPISVETKVLAKGPIFADVRVQYDFPDFQFWRLRFRVIAGQPVVLVDEEFDLPEGSKYLLDLADGWSPDQLYYRDNGNRCRLSSIGKVQGDPLFYLQAWPLWWGEELRANWVTVCGGKESHTLTLAARDPGVWVTPGKTDWETAVLFDRQLVATFQLNGFARNWMFVALPRDEAIREDDMGERIAPPPQQYLIRCGDFPLDRVKDYVLSWDDRRTPHPRLFTTPAELQRFRKRFAVDEQRLEELRKKAIFGYTMDEHVAYFLATQDETLARQLADLALLQLQRSVDGYVKQQELRNPGSCPHHRNRSVLWGAIAADLAMSSKVLTVEERNRLKAQLAFLAYTLERPLVISPERGFNANPNMTTMARGMLGVIACTIPHHPRAQAWAELAIAEMDHELTDWCGANGGWLEAPHYATASLDTIISLALALRGTGFTETEWQFHPKLRAAVTWLAKISTPPDARLNGWRHMPAIGNTYLGEPSCLAGWMATIWRDKDPAFSRQMQWVWKTHGMPQSPGIGGAYPGLQGYSHLMLDDSIAAEPPRWTSELFPDAGAVFRAHFPGDSEYYLHYIQGVMHQHYDFDEGSFIFWGQGSPLCEDFGYYGRAPAADHSRIDDGFYEALGLEGRIREFTAGQYIDYLCGERHGWYRQILFVKDQQPLGPNYLLVRDAVLNGRDFDWRVWIATDEQPPIDQNPVRAKGRFGVDLTVYFLTTHERKLISEQTTRTAGTAGWGHNNRSTTQRSLCLQQLPAAQPIAVVLYPVRAEQPTPKFTSLAGGRAVKIESPQGVDYAMLSIEDFDFEQDDVVFHGRAGAIQIRQNGPQLSLPRRGSLAYRGKQLEVSSEPERSLTR